MIPEIIRATLAGCPHCGGEVIFSLEKVKTPQSIINTFKKGADYPKTVLHGAISCGACGAGMGLHSSRPDELMKLLENNWNQRVAAVPVDIYAVSDNKERHEDADAVIKSLEAQIVELKETAKSS